MFFECMYILLMKWIFTITQGMREVTNIKMLSAYAMKRKIEATEKKQRSDKKETAKENAVGEKLLLS